MKNAKKIFKTGSKTYYYSSLSFPNDIRDKVTTLYAFVRTADDFVDVQPPKKKAFNQFVRQTQKAFQGHRVPNATINSFYSLTQECKFEEKWVWDFLAAMKTDLTKKHYRNFKELEKYMYGSAEVIGFFMAKILDLPLKAYPYAALQGKAMQLINFIRDIEEDLALGRTYLNFKTCQVTSLPPKSDKEIDCFNQAVRQEIARYQKIQSQAAKGYQYIPKKYLVPIKTAADIYGWTARKIHSKPMIVFEKKVKPSKLRIFSRFLINSLTL